MERDIRMHWQLQNDWRSVLLKLLALTVQKSLLGFRLVMALKARGKLVALTFSLILFKTQLLLLKLSWSRKKEHKTRCRQVGLPLPPANKAVVRMFVVQPGLPTRLIWSWFSWGQQMECFLGLKSLWGLTHYKPSNWMASINNDVLFSNEFQVHQTDSCPSPSESKDVLIALRWQFPMASN